MGPWRGLEALQASHCRAGGAQAQQEAGNHGATEWAGVERTTGSPSSNPCHGYSAPSAPLAGWCGLKVRVGKQRMSSVVWKGFCVCVMPSIPARGSPQASLWLLQPLPEQFPMWRLEPASPAASSPVNLGHQPGLESHEDGPRLWSWARRLFLYSRGLQQGVCAGLP